MALDYRVLGDPGRDNSLYVRIDTGHDIQRLLFDCGEGCPQQLPISDIQAIDLIAFSHFHIDHVASFDSFLRHNYTRPEGAVQIVGPPSAADIIQRRLCGFTWNMIEGTPGEFLVTEIHPDRLKTVSLLTTEAFAVRHAVAEEPFERCVYEHEFYQVEAIRLEHGTTSVGYCVREKLRHNVDAQVLDRWRLPAGPWLQTIKDPDVDDQRVIEIGDRSFRVAQLRERLMVDTIGDSIAYLTDFRLEDAAWDELVEFLRGCQTLVCENNYANCDADLAVRNFHMVSRDVARLADRVQPERLVLIHLSDRYTAPGWRQQLAEVRRLFPRAYFPDHWQLDECGVNG